MANLRMSPFGELSGLVLSHLPSKQLSQMVSSLGRKVRGQMISMSCCRLLWAELPDW